MEQQHINTGATGPGNDGTGDSIRVAYLLDMKWEASSMESVLKNSFDRDNLFV